MGVRRAKTDPQLKALRELLLVQTDPAARVEVEKLISERLARLNPAPPPSPRAGTRVAVSNDPAAELIRHFTRALGAREVRSRREVGTKPIVYCVTNGRNILQIGQGVAKRVKGLFAGSRCPKHTKAFIVAASSVIHGRDLRFFILEVEDAPERRRIEGELQVKFGKTSIEGYGRASSLAEVSTFLWDELRRLRPGAMAPDFTAALELALHDGDALYVAYQIPRHAARLERLFDGYFKP